MDEKWYQVYFDAAGVSVKVFTSLQLAEQTAIEKLKQIDIDKLKMTGCRRME